MLDGGSGQCPDARGPTTPGPTIGGRLRPSARKEYRFLARTPSSRLESENLKGIRLRGLKQGCQRRRLLARTESDTRALPRGGVAPWPRNAAAAARELEANGHRNYSAALHIPVASRPHPLLGQQLTASSTDLGRKMWVFARYSLLAAFRADVPGDPPAFAHLTGREAAYVAHFKLCEHRVRHLSGSDRFHADDSFATET